MTVGGGIRSLGDIELLLKSGADKVAINSFGTEEPNFINEAVKNFGSSTIVIYVEAKKISEKKWEVYAIKYAERNDRTRNDSFIFDDHAHEQHSIDYFIWVLKNNDQIVLVDTGYDQEEANRRNRPIIRSPSKAIRDFGINPEKIKNIS